MESSPESNNVLLKSVVTIAVISSVAAAAALLWLRSPATKSRRIMDRCEDALSELEHRSPRYDFRQTA